eukprot:1964293-Pyramimonas_sp.AAC.1
MAGRRRRHESDPRPARRTPKPPSRSTADRASPNEDFPMYSNISETWACQMQSQGLRNIVQRRWPLLKKRHLKGTCCNALTYKLQAASHSKTGRVHQDPCFMP